MIFTSTIDNNLQEILHQNIDNIVDKYFAYNNIKEIADINFSKNKNILDAKNNITNIKKSDLFKNEKVFLYPSEYEETAYNEIKLTNNDKIQILDNGIKFRDYYSIDNGFKLHRFEPLYFKKGEYYKKGDSIYIKDKSQIKSNINIDEDGYLYFDSEELVYDKIGQTQPQIAGIVIDNKTNKIIATINGRKIEENFLNRSKMPRQVGSVIKPISVYLPSLDNGKNINDYVIDKPYTTKDGYSPRNWYKGYRGRMTIEESLAESVNVTTVKLAEELGIDTIKSHLEKLGLIYEDDTFIESEENQLRNDENYSALALGGLTYGFSPRDIISSYTVFPQEGYFEKAKSFNESKENREKLFRKKCYRWY
ncbi:penicillin-binding transpeptidase domain-containing protein [Peptoniphilus timonensis]|uniref:penicillin-binding transpeptidase domain-containing protein n=1 Tax=Peptoniphilus timonensis TaxID=1268254 RepID=UPI0002E2BBFA|nr:penicillin-binding transpeptidase domain-containing protein [Peptoniphilus timonensis]